MTSRHEPRLGCGAAIIIDGRILLVQRLTEPEARCWGLPGGKIDLYETAAAAVRREIAEEIGVDIEPADLLCLVDYIDTAAGQHWLAPVYLITSLAEEPRNLEPEKHGALAWFPVDAAPAPLTCAAATALRAWHARSVGSASALPDEVQRPIVTDFSSV